MVVARDTPPPPPPAPGQPAAVAPNPAEGPEILLAVWDDGSISALNGHVDLGTGLRTSLAQIVAEELDAPFDRVHMVLGDTARAPNQGATIASASIQIHAAPLRQAAAQARAWLIERASEMLGAPPSMLRTRDGRVELEGGEHAIAYAQLVAGRRQHCMLSGDVALKAPQDYRIVGTSQARVDIPAKLAGELVFVHDMRLPGMLHGRVVRPPYAGADHGDFIGRTLESVDESSIAHIPGVRAVVVQGDFVGVVAEREELAEQAMRELVVRWKPWPGMPSLADVEGALRANPATQRLLVDEGDVDGALQAAARPMPRTYLWPFQMHASIGPSCAVAHWCAQDEAGATRLRVWAGTQNPHVLRRDLAQLAELDELAVDVVRMEAAGCYGRNGADDAAADAALLARAVGAPVRVQLTREQEHAWEPKGAAQLMQVRGGLDAQGGVAAYDFETSYPSNGAPTLALLLTGRVEAKAQAFEMGDRTARPPYEFGNLRVKVNDMAPIVRASWLRGVSALPNAFAHESYVDELATAAGVDPVAFRLRHLHDPRAVDLVRATADKAGWRPRIGPQENSDGGLGPGGDILFGQGFAYARYVHSKWPGFGAAWSAWVADVEVNRKTGEVHVRRVVVGHDAGLVVNPAGVEHQVHGNVIQATSRALKEQVRFAPEPTPPAAGTSASAGELAPIPGQLPAGVVASREWGSYPILNFREVPVIEVLQVPRPGEAPLGAGESASVPGTAAIANAIFDATGIRFRAPPFTPEVVRAALHPLAAPPAGGGSAGAHGANAGAAATPPDRAGEHARSSAPANAPWPRRRAWWATAGALIVGGLGAIAGLLGWRPSIAPVTITTPVFSDATIERGRVLAALGDCAVCHTAPGGAVNAGGRPMQTPFGTIYSTNLTPDAQTGLGHWSFSAFQRAMREGISRDGHHLYPVFPYTDFAKTSDDDLTALYAYFMSLPPVRSETPPAELQFPFGMRPLMGVWNALFHDPAPYAPQPDRSAQWNRGAYLVEGLGHCGACHTPRNAMGAEQTGQSHFAGALVDGWEAPPLTALASKSAVPWTADALYRYLRHGYSAEHGAAGGPMAQVVRELAAVPDEDVRAMATYLASFQGDTSEAQARQLAQQAVRRASQMQPTPGVAQRLFDGACAACHHDGDGPTLIGANVPLALNSNLTSARPDNLLRTLLEGVREPATRDIGFMPSFAEVLDDAQIVELASWMRARFAPQEAPWPDLARSVREARAAATHEAAAQLRASTPSAAGR
nr:molybdopterin cofactor-binding domain-containing protein [Variovorax dokdonensis]